MRDVSPGYALQENKIQKKHFFFFVLVKNSEEAQMKEAIQLARRLGPFIRYTRLIGYPMQGGKLAYN